MNKGLEALSRLKEILKTVDLIELDEFKIIETELKRLEELVDIERNNERFWKQTAVKQDEILRIIKEKRVDVLQLKESKNVSYYNKVAICYFAEEHTKEKDRVLNKKTFDLLKEWLK